jgi:hypothetical protein
MTILSLFFRRVPCLVALIASVAVVMALPASAQQQQNMQKYGEPDKEKTPAEKAAEKEAQKAYERSLGNIPAQKTTDPWGIARGDTAAPKDAAKPATKTASPKPKAKNDTKTDIKTDSAAKQ